MSDYVYTKYTGFLSSLENSEVRARWEKQFLDADVTNERLYADRIQKHGELLALTREVFGGEHAATKYMRRQKVPAPKRDANKKAWEKVLAELADYQHQQRVYANRSAGSSRGWHKRRRTEGLIEHGFILGQDFNRETAIEDWERLMVWDTAKEEWVRRDGKVVSEGAAQKEGGIR